MKSSEQNRVRFTSIVHNGLFLAILIAAGALRFYRLDYEGLWLDEIGQVMVAQNPLVQVILQAAKHYGNTPLDYIVTHFALYFGKSEGVLRLPAVLWGVLSVLVIYQVGKTVFGRRTGLLAAFLLAFLPIHIYYSREVRFYSLATLFGLLSVLFFLKAARQNTRKAWMVFAVVQTFALYAHYYILAVTAVEAAWLLLHALLKRYDRAVFTRFLTAAGTALLLFLPWFIYDLHYEQTYKQGILNASAYFRFHFPALRALWAANFFYYTQNYTNSAWWLAFSLLCLIGGLLLAIRLRKADTAFSSGIMLFFFLYAGGLGCVFLLDAIASYNFISRQLLIFSPFLLLITAAALVKGSDLLVEIIASILKQDTPRHIGLQNGILVGAAVFNIWSLSAGMQSIYSTEIARWQIHRQDWRGSGEFLTANMGPNDILLSTHPHISFYAQDVAPQTRWLPDDANFIKNMAHTYDRVWIFTTFDRLPTYPHLTSFLEQEKPLEVSLYPQLRLYVYSAKSSSAKLLKDLLLSDSIMPSTLILTNIIDQAIAEKFNTEMFDTISTVLKRSDFETINKTALASRAGEAFLKAGDFPHAASLFTKTVEYEPKNALWWKYLGYAYTRQNQAEAAIAAYQKAITLGAKDYPSYQLLAKNLISIRNWDEALKAQEKAMQLADNDAQRTAGLNQLAWVYESLGDFNKACQSYSQSYRIQNDPNILKRMQTLPCKNNS